jgi:hypothetical protein
MNFEEEAVAKRINKKVTMTKKTTAVCLLRKSFKNHHLYYCHNSRKREREREKLLFNSNNKNSMGKTCEYTELKISILVSLHVASVLIFDVSPPLSE